MAIVLLTCLNKQIKTYDTKDGKSTKQAKKCNNKNTTYQIIDTMVGRRFQLSTFQLDVYLDPERERERDLERERRRRPTGAGATAWPGLMRLQYERLCLPVKVNLPLEGPC